jgi:type IX secretion system substrate protein/VCBS repeat protein
MKKIIYFLFSILFIIGSTTLTMNAAVQNIPSVNCTIIRIDFNSYTFNGYYEFTKPFKKTIPEEGYYQEHNVYYQVEQPCDFGFIDIKSILTSEQLIYISTYWCNGGILEYPADSLFSNVYNTGYVNADPDTVIKLFMNGADSIEADYVWDLINDTDIINRISTVDNYEVIIVKEINIREWILIVFTRPNAPIDVALLNKFWPKKYMTNNVNTIPEIVVHNYSDSTISLKTLLEVNQNNQILYSSINNVIDINPDSSEIVFFDTLLLNQSISSTFQYNLLNINGSIWQDVYTNNDTINSIINFTNQPIFRPISSIKHPGKIPTRGVACDFDGDSDIDIIQYRPLFKLLQYNNSQYNDITMLSNINTNSDLRLAAVDYIDNNNYPDILLISFNHTPILLSGDGTGVFHDITESAGLSNINAYFDVEAFDMENDFDLDLVFQTYDQEIVMMNNGDGTFSDITSASGIVDLGQTQDISSGDFNNDSYKDLFITNWGNPSKLFMNNGDNTFTYINGPWNFDYGRMSKIFDIDKDGLNDLLICRSLSDETTLIYSNNGNFNFQHIGDLTSSFKADIIDFNGDNNLDLLLDEIDRFKLLVNKNGTFHDYTHLLIDMENEISYGSLGTSPKGQFVDLDNDGDLDIYSQMMVFENQGFDPALTQIISNPYKQIPKRFVLKQNYPNPFNPITIISFTISVDSKVKLEIFDVLGRKIKTLENAFKNAGTYEYKFDGYNLSSGIYLYRISTENFSAMKKMLLVK